MTPRQSELLTFIKTYSLENGYAPSYREMSAAFGSKHPASIYRMVQNLIAQGHLKAARKYRSGRSAPHDIEVADNAPTVIVKVDSQGQYLHTVKSGNVNVSVETVSG